MKGTRAPRQSQRTPIGSELYILNEDLDKVDRIILLLVALAVGGGAGYFITKDQREVIEVTSASVVGEPEAVVEVITTRTYSQSTAFAVRENTTFGRENNAVMYSQWTSQVLIGIDFTTFEWSDLDGIGDTVPETGAVTISGELPALEILDNFVDSGSEVEDVISRNWNYDEEGELGSLLDAQRQAMMDCVAERALYRSSTLEDAHNAVRSLIEPSIPRREDGSLLATFDLRFANEDELRSIIDSVGETPPPCEASITVHAP